MGIALLPPPTLSTDFMGLCESIAGILFYGESQALPTHLRHSVRTSAATFPDRRPPCCEQSGVRSSTEIVPSARAEWSAGGPGGEDRWRAPWRFPRTPPPNGRP